MEIVQHLSVRGAASLVMLFHMWVIGRQIVVVMLQHFGIVRGPERDRQHDAEERDARRRRECRAHAAPRPDLPNKRVCYQPADVA